jgi:hypothetical protein
MTGRLSWRQPDDHTCPAGNTWSSRLHPEPARRTNAHLILYDQALLIHLTISRTSGRFPYIRIPIRKIFAATSPEM